MASFIVYKTHIISTIVDFTRARTTGTVYKTHIISTIVDPKSYKYEFGSL